MERERNAERGARSLCLAINVTEIIIVVVVVIKRVALARVASFHFGGTAARRASTP